MKKIMIPRDIPILYQIKKITIVVAILLLACILVILFQARPHTEVSESPRPTITLAQVIVHSPTPSPLPQPQPAKILDSGYHIFQTFNNCGPAALSMALSYYGITVYQDQLGEALRPYQVPGGNNDDKSVTLAELAVKAEEFGLVAFHRPNGNVTLIQKFIAADIPVIARTWLKQGEDIGHYRIVKGYDDNTRELIQDDSLQGKNLRYSYDSFNTLWQAFNYEYLVLVPPGKVEIARAVMGADADEHAAWLRAKDAAEEQLRQNRQDPFAGFNLSVAYYYLDEYQKSVEAYEQVATRLPWRMLWYQIEPILAYQRLKKYDIVFAMTNNILNNHNRAFSELYQIRGEIYREQGNTEAARQEFLKAIQYNKNYLPAREALSSL